MAIKAKKQPAKYAVGDKVRILHAGGKTVSDTVWEITDLFGGFRCLIKEAGTDYAEQAFDTSMIRPA